jgi:hypothetical protein
MLHVHMQVDQRHIKKKVLRRLQEHASACATLTAAGVLRLWQRQPLALLVVAAWTGEGHQLAKILAWRAWSGYTLRRIRFKALLGLRSAAPEVLNLAVLFAGWCAATKLRPAVVPIATSLSSKPETTPGEAKRVRLGAPRPQKVGASEVMATALPWRYMPALPPLWRESVPKRKILEVVDASERMSESMLRRKVAAILQIKV